MIFPYEKHQFIINTIMFAVLTAFLIIILSPLSGSDAATMIVLGVLGGALTLVLGVSPLITDHEMNDHSIKLRQGLYFTAEIPLEEINDVRRLEKGPFRTGVFFSVRDSILYATTRRTDLIEIRLKEKRAFGWALGKKADRVIFDTKDNRRFFKTLEDRTGLIPSSLGRSS